MIISAWLLQMAAWVETAKASLGSFAFTDGTNFDDGTSWAQELIAAFTDDTFFSDGFSWSEPHIGAFADETVFDDGRGWTD